YERAVANGVPGVRLIGPEELREIEPCAAGVAAVHSPDTAIVDFAAITTAMAAEIERCGAVVARSRKVTGITQDHGQVRVRVPGDEYAFSRVVICAGLHGDRLAGLAGAERDPAIV